MPPAALCDPSKPYLFSMTENEEPKGNKQAAYGPAGDTNDQDDKANNKSPGEDVRTRLLVKRQV